MLNERASTSTVAVDGNTIEKVDRYVYLGKTVTQTGDLLREIKRRIALGWAAFSKVANIMKSRKASMNVKRKVHNEYVLPVMVYCSETWALKKAHHENGQDDREDLKQDGETALFATWVLRGQE